MRAGINKYVKFFLITYAFITFLMFYLCFSISYIQISEPNKRGVDSCHLVPKIYIITPTYARLVQKAELTRLVHTLKLVECLHWIVVEDAAVKSKLVENLLLKSDLRFTHLNVQTPASQKLKSEDPRWKKARGVLQRNEGLMWMRLNNVTEGVVYFADDDNTYDLQLFEEMRQTQKVSVWPVGLVGKLRYESPLLNHRGKVVGWRTKWKTHRTFALDMAGFAVNINLLRQQQASFSIESYIGELENDFLRQLVSLADLEAKANNCSEVLVWHTQSKEPNLKNELHFDSGQHNIEI